ncbi:hypothetical protein BJ742DRAFT_313668 [Cladochytrium replicatum]|nr:hypothetical protein BJ742DRAFT_313668 [Cladochytrium replicatum]
MAAPTKLCVITGAAQGLGFGVAKKLLLAGDWHVVIAGRNAEKINKAVSSLSSVIPANSKITALPANLELASNKSVIDYVDAYVASGLGPVDLLVLNAGTWPSKLKRNDQGLEDTFASNHLGHWILTMLFLEKKLVKTPGRIVVVTSSLHDPTRMTDILGTYEFDFDDLDAKKTEASGVAFNGAAMYRRSKLANVWFTYQLDEYLRTKVFAKEIADGKPLPITVNTLCPGFVPATGLARESSWINKFLMATIFVPFTTPYAAAENHMIDICTRPELATVSAKYFDERQKGKETESAPETYNKERARKLWDVSIQLTGLTQFAF